MKIFCNLKGVKISRHSNGLFNKLVKKHGLNNVGSENNNQGNSVDIVVQKGEKYWFYEIKTYLNCKSCIREALGQLLEYSLWPGSQIAERLIIVGEAELDKEGKEYLNRLRSQFEIPIYYEQITL